MNQKIRKITFKGRTYIDIRKFFTPKGQTDAVPSKKGISIPIEELSSTITELEQFEKEAAYEKKEGDVK